MLLRQYTIKHELASCNYLLRQLLMKLLFCFVGEFVWCNECCDMILCWFGFVIGLFVVNTSALLNKNCIELNYYCY